MENTPKQKTTRKLLGDFGEQIACDWYSDRGYKIEDRNVTISRIGEIDVIASKAYGSHVDLRFIEVKTRSSNKTGYGYEAVNLKKRIRMLKTAMVWIDQNIDRSRTKIKYQLDVMSIDTSTKPHTISVFENIEI